LRWYKKKKRRGNRKRKEKEPEVAEEGVRITAEKEKEEASENMQTRAWEIHLGKSDGTRRKGRRRSKNEKKKKRDNYVKNREGKGRWNQYSPTKNGKLLLKNFSR